MKFRSIVVSAFLLISSAAFAWNCSDPLAARVAVGTTQPAGTEGDGDGQWFLGTGTEGTKGVYYVCEVPKKNGGGGPTSTSTSSSNQSQGQGQGQGQQQGQTANGGAGGSATSGASATGGNSNATGGNATGGSSSSKSGVSNSGNSSATGGAGGSGGAGGAGGSVAGSGNSNVGVGVQVKNTNKLSNSGNSSNTNTNTANGGSANGNGSNNTTSASSNQTQSNSSTNANQSSASNQSNGNGSNSNDTTNNVYGSKIPANTAYAPTTIPTSPCIKTYSGGGQGTSFGFSIGGSKIDKNCALLETARAFDAMNERLAGCKVKVSSEYAKNAGVTLEDCMAIEMVPAPPPAPVVAPTPVIPPTPQVIVLQPPAPVAAPAPVQAPTALPAIVWTSVCTFASKTSCTVPGADAVLVDPARPTSICKIMIDSAVRAFKQSPGSRFVLVGDRNREESDLLPRSRTTRVRQQLEAAGVPASAIEEQIGSEGTRTVSIILIQAGS